MPTAEELAERRQVLGNTISMLQDELRRVDVQAQIREIVDEAIRRRVGGSDA